jgi:hypothetical protein
VEGFTLTFTSGGDSIVDFGWIDEDKYTGSISYVDVTQWASGETFWSFWVSLPAATLHVLALEHD